MLVINTNSHAVQVTIDAPYGEDVVHIQAKGRVNLGAGKTVNSNWLALNGKGIVIPTQKAPSVAQSYSNFDEESGDGTDR